MIPKKMAWVLLLTVLVLAAGCEKEKLELAKKTPSEISLRSEIPAKVLWDHGQALEINNHNQVVGYQYEWMGSYHVFYPILWDNGVVSKPWDYGYAYSINNRSQIIGFKGLPYNYTAVLWESGNLTELWSDGIAYSSNRQGQIVGYQGNNAVLWDQGQLTVLWENGEARYINDRGQVVGYRGDEEYFEAMFWEKGQAYPISDNSVAAFIDNRGRVFGVEDYTAVVWDNEETTILWNDGAVFRANLTGEVVGYFYIDKKMDAAYWKEGTAVVLMENAAAYSINTRGQIVGASFIRPLKALMWEGIK